MIDLCESCTRWDICYLNQYMHFYHHNESECDRYVASQQKRSAIIKAHPPHSVSVNVRPDYVFPCQQCGSTNTHKYGKRQDDELRWVRRQKCRDCGEIFDKGEGKEVSRTIERRTETPDKIEKGEIGSIQMRQTLKDKLVSMKEEGESFEDVIARIIEKSKK